MADATKISWTDATWNPIVGCSVVSPGCTNCYAMRAAARIVRCSAGAGRVTHYEVEAVFMPHMLTASGETVIEHVNKHGLLPAPREA